MIDVDFSQLINVVEDLESDMEMLQSITQDANFIQDLTEIIATNFEEVFGTKGSSIGEDWNGNDLVDSGDLRISLTSPGLIGVTFTSNGIVFESNVNYAKYVNDDYKFYGLSSNVEDQIGELIGKALKERGKLNYV